MRQNNKKVNDEPAEGTADGKAKVTKRADLGETTAVERVELAAGINEEHHAVMGQKGDGKEKEDAHEPSGALEGVRKTKNTSADDSNEDVGEGLELARKRRPFAEKRRVLPRRWWHFKGIRGGGGGARSLLVKPHLNFNFRRRGNRKLTC